MANGLTTPADAAMLQVILQCIRFLLKCLRPPGCITSWTIFTRMKFFLIIILLLLCQATFAQITYNEVFVDYDSVYEYKNLKIIPIRKKAGAGAAAQANVISLQAALQKGLATVSERGSASTENVHWLRINNRSGLPLYIGSGEVVAGGRQDRMITRDTIMIPTGGDQYVPAMCVEENRWSDRERKFTYRGYANPRLRRVLDRSKNQLLIWKEIYAQLDSSKIQSPTLSYNARKLDKKYLLVEDEYLRFFRERMLEKDSGIAGIICISGDKIIGSDVFNSAGLFHDQAISLLSGYIEEAVAFGAEPDVDDDIVRKYANEFLTDEESQEIYLKNHGKMYKSGNRLIHLTAFSQK